MKRSLPAIALLLIILAACQSTPPNPAATTAPAMSTSTTNPESTLMHLETINPSNAAHVQLLMTLPIPDFRVGRLSQCSIAFNPDGTLLSGVCYQNTIPIWDAQSGKLVRTLESSPVQEVAIAFSPDGKQVATGGFSGIIRLWDLSTGQVIQSIGPTPAPIWDLSFSPEGDRLASATFDINRSGPAEAAGFHLWNLAGGDLLWDTPGDNRSNQVLSVDYAPDGGTIAFGTFDSALVLDAQQGTLIRTLSIPDHVGDLAFSPDGSLLATASDDHKVRLWETGGYTSQSTLEGQSGYINGVAFSPDGRLIVSGCHDRTVGIWDVATGQLLNLLEGHESEVLRVTINPSGTLIASVSWDGTVRLWGVSQ